jgi:hypothetical protein
MTMKRETIGTYPYAVTKEHGLTVIRFYPKKADAQYPDDAVLVLKLNDKDKQTLIKLLSQ